ncbi:bacterio-opsin activator domain-containing protein [Halomarina ordinaria]|uniref:Bacterio-opsin activator domain-containing protein n=1 Tax=Halomarina ordinaria TaxID=3033939 RepID=A0ABD5UEK2_9EURY|nr:bacterio-opsin activator domain-containing protein [Halomarina sp. PSRA2]
MRVLAVSDGDELLAALDRRTTLALTAVSEGSDALSRLDDADCVVLIDGGGVDAVALLERLRASIPALPVVVVADDGTVASDAVAAGVSEYVPKDAPDVDDRLYGRVIAAADAATSRPTDRNARMPIEDLGLREELRLKERAIDEAPVGITIADADRPDEPMVYINDAFERLTGYSKERVVGQNCRFLQGEDSDPEAVAAMRGAIDAGEQVSVELLNYRKSGEPFWNRVDIAPVHGSDGSVSHFVGFQTDITERREAEMQVERERRSLEHLLVRIDGLLRDVTRTLVGSGGRVEVERGVCDSFVAVDTYEFAWLGVPDRSSDTLAATASAGEWAVSLDDLHVDLTASDPPLAATAYETGELRVVTDDATLAAIAEDSPWMAAGAVHGIAAVPLVYGETTYGVLSLYATEEAALNEHERVVLEAIGRSTATALNALERGRMLATDSVRQLDIETTDGGLFFVELSAQTGCSLTYNGSVYRDDGSVLMFFQSDGDAEAVLAAAEQYSHIASGELIHEHGREALLEFTVTDDSLPATLAERGVQIRAIAVDDGVATIELELPSEGDVRAIADLLSERYPATEIVAQRERERPPSTRQAFVGEVEERLTERQLTALQKAYVSGFYEWDRPVTGDTLAESMDIGRATYHQHLRAAERKLIGAFFER